MHTYEPKAEPKREHPCPRSRLVRARPGLGPISEPEEDHGSHWVHLGRYTHRHPFLGYSA